MRLRCSAMQPADLSSIWGHFGRKYLSMEKQKIHRINGLKGIFISLKKDHNLGKVGEVLLAILYPSYQSI